MTRLVCPLQSLRHCSCVHLQETLYVVGKKGRGYEWNYDRARSDPSWLLMEMPINVGCATLLWSWRRTCSWGRRQNKPIATQSSPDSHRMCCCDQLGIPSYHPCSASSIQIATANSVPGQIMYCPPCPPWVIATPYFYGSPNLQWGPSQYGPFIHVLWRGTPILVSVDACSSLLRITLRQLLKKKLVQSSIGMQLRREFRLLSLEHWLYRMRTRMELSK